MRRPSPIRSFFFASFVCFVVTSSAAQAAPRDELLRLVPDDLAFCLVVQDLRGHGRALAASPFMEAFRKSPFAAALKDSDELRKLTGLDAELRKQIGLDSAGIADKLLGDAFVLAYRPNPPGKTGEDQGLFLLRTQDAPVLADFIERLNRAQKESGDLKEVEERRHEGVAYFRRVERNGANYYYANGPVLAFSSQEALLRRAIERDRKQDGTEAGVARQLRLLGVERALAALWINPRAFDAEMARNLEKAAGADKVVQRAFLRYWKALDGAALALRLEQDARLTLTLRARTDDLPPAARRLLAEASRPSDLWERFPDDALFAAAGRLDLAALLDGLTDFQTAEARAALVNALEGGLGLSSGKDFFRELLPALGPDVGLCLLAPGKGDKGPLPQGLLAVRVRSEAAGNGVLAALDFYARLAALASHGQDKAAITLKSVRQGKLEVKYLSSDKAFPAGVQPAWTVKDGYLLLASSPEVVRRFGTGKPPAEAPLLRLSARALSAYLTAQRDGLVPLIADKNNLGRDEAARRLDGVRAALDFFDRIELHQASEPGQLSLTLRIKTLLPLR